MQVWLPVLRELDCASTAERPLQVYARGILRRAELPVSVAALDVSAAPAPPASFLWEYPAGLEACAFQRAEVVAPHLQLIMPRSLDGEDSPLWTQTVDAMRLAWWTSMAPGPPQTCCALPVVRMSCICPALR